MGMVLAMPARSYSNPSADPVRPVPYNPLEKAELARSVEGALLSTALKSLDGVPEFYGTGIYVIYYNGDHELYRVISGASAPIYVGKAVPSGARKGLASKDAVGKELWNRISEHRESTERAQDLDPSDFDVRYLVAEDIFIPLAERLMIQTFQPVWNVVVDGFGNHDPGIGRSRQKTSPWDCLHPGRTWATKLTPCKYSRGEIVARVLDHFVSRQLVPAEASLPPAVPSTLWDDTDVEVEDE
jgi:Eco29kI-like restriction endonuclease